MNIRMYALVCASALVLAAGPAFGGSPEKGEKGEKMDPAKTFEAIDADGNGGMSLAEVKAHVEKKYKDKEEDPDMAKLEEKFAKWDGNESGEISMEEWKAAHEKKKEEMKEKKEGGE